MKEDDVISIIEDGGGMIQYLDPKHENFDVDTALLLASMRPDLFTPEQITKLKRIKELDSSFQN